MDLTDPQIERYSRQILLREVGGAGQEKIRSARVLVAGEGSAVAIAALYLSAAGVGEICLACGARNRAITDDISALNPETCVRPLVHGEVSDALAARHDLLVDLTVDAELRAALSRAALAADRRLIAGDYGGDHGFVVALQPRCGHGCLACVEWPPLAATATPLTPSLSGVVATVMATEVLKAIVGAGESLAGHLLRIDACGPAYARDIIRRRRSCPVCGVT